MKKSVVHTGFLLMQFIGLMAMAQNASVTGVVYENDQAKTSFTTPAGKITVSFPDDLRPGDVISGTVYAEPFGKEAKEQKKNISALSDFKIILPDDKPLNVFTITQNSEPYTNFSFIVPDGKPLQIVLENRDNKILSTVTVPVLPAIAGPAGYTRKETYTLSKKIIPNDEPLVLFTPKISKNITSLILSDYFSGQSSQTRQPVILKPVSVSARKLIFRIPDSLSGFYKACVQNTEGKTQFVDLVNIVDMRASIDKSNLAKGEQTELHITISGLEGCPYRPVKLNLSNTTPNVIQLTQGNQQTIPLETELKLVTNSTEPFFVQQAVTGITPGSFVINTHLHIPASAYANPLAPYMAEINTPQQFNSSANALKNDISRYLSDAGTDKNLAAYLEQVRDYIPEATNANSLGKSKATLLNLFNEFSQMNGGNSFFRQLSDLNKQQPEIEAETKITQFIHPVRDLVAEFDSKSKILKVSSTYSDELLKYLGAIKNGNGNYSISLSDGTQPVMYTDILLRPTSEDPNDPLGIGCVNSPGGPPSFLQANEEASSKKDTTDKAGSGQPSKELPSPASDSPQNSEAANSSSSPGSSTAKKDSIEWAQLVTEFKDSTGRSYRFYKDAECKELYSLNGGDCRPEVIFGEYHPETGKRDDKPTGNYVKNIFQSAKHCLKGTGFCTEMYQITTLTLIYSDKDCQNLIDTKKFYGFRCQ